MFSMIPLMFAFPVEQSNTTVSVTLYPNEGCSFGRGTEMPQRTAANQGCSDQRVFSKTELKAI